MMRRLKALWWRNWLKVVPWRRTLAQAIMEWDRGCDCISKSETVVEEACPGCGQKRALCLTCGGVRWFYDEHAHWCPYWTAWRDVLKPKGRKE